MAKLILDIPDSLYDRVISHVCRAYNYDALSGIDPAVFVQQIFLNQMFAIVKSQEVGAAVAEAKLAAETKADAEVMLTVVSVPIQPAKADPAE